MLRVSVALIHCSRMRIGPRPATRRISARSSARPCSRSCVALRRSRALSPNRQRAWDVHSRVDPGMRSPSACSCRERESRDRLQSVATPSALHSTRYAPPTTTTRPWCALPPPASCAWKLMARVRTEPFCSLLNKFWDFSSFAIR